jgi:peptidoglycan hydrolase CwlO-like protein
MWSAPYHFPNLRANKRRWPRAAGDETQQGDTVDRDVEKALKSLEKQLNEGTKQIEQMGKQIYEQETQIDLLQDQTKEIRRTIKERATN